MQFEHLCIWTNPSLCFILIIYNTHLKFYNNILSNVIEDVFIINFVFYKNSVFYLKL